MIRRAFWLGAVAVPAQIGANDMKAARKLGRHAVPHYVSLGIAVQQQQRAPGSTVDQINFRAARCYRSLSKVFAEHS
jgi:hypothetical protein